jgi:hypothetical protein
MRGFTPHPLFVLAWAIVSLSSLSRYKNSIRSRFLALPGKCHFGGASIGNAAEAEPPELHSWLKARNEKSRDEPFNKGLKPFVNVAIA